MKTSYYNLTFSLLAASLLYACGGGSGGSTPNLPPSIDIQPPSTQPSPNPPSLPEKNDPQDQSPPTLPSQQEEPQWRGAALFLQQGETRFSREIVAQDWKDLSVDGVRIPFPAELKDGVFSLSADESLELSTQGMSYSRFGTYVRRENSIPKILIFAYGPATQDMPQTGSARYQGHALHDDPNGHFNASAEFTVDFSAKQLHGFIRPEETNRIGDHPSFSQVALQAHIHGNHFSSPEGQAFSTQGTFTGPEAAELLGVYSNNHNSAGAFSAKKE